MSDKPFLEFRDPQEMASMFSTEHGLTMKELVEAKFDHSISEVRKMLFSLPKEEMDFVFLYFIIGKTQEEIADIYGRSQGDISYRINRILKRLRFTFSLPKINYTKMREDLNFLSKEELDILQFMSKSSSQTVTGKKVGISQGRVRYKFLNSLDEIKNRLGPDNTYVKYFEKVSQNFNILRALASRDYENEEYMDYLGTA